MDPVSTPPDLRDLMCNCQHSRDIVYNNHENVHNQTCLPLRSHFPELLLKANLHNSTDELSVNLGD